VEITPEILLASDTHPISDMFSPIDFFYRFFSLYRMRFSAAFLAIRTSPLGSNDRHLLEPKLFTSFRHMGGENHDGNFLDFRSKSKL